MREAGMGPDLMVSKRIKPFFSVFAEVVTVLYTQSNKLLKKQSGGVLSYFKAPYAKRRDTPQEQAVRGIKMLYVIAYFQLQSTILLLFLDKFSSYTFSYFMCYAYLLSINDKAS